MRVHTLLLALILLPLFSLLHCRPAPRAPAARSSRHAGCTARPGSAQNNTREALAEKGSLWRLVLTNRGASRPKVFFRETVRPYLGGR